MIKGGVSHFVLKGSDASHQGSLATLEGSCGILGTVATRFIASEGKYRGEVKLANLSIKNFRKFAFSNRRCHENHEWGSFSPKNKVSTGH